MLGLVRLRMARVGRVSARQAKRRRRGASLDFLQTNVNR